MRWFEEEIQRILAKEQEYMVARFLHQHPELDIEDVELVFNHYRDGIEGFGVSVTVKERYKK